MKLYTKDGRLRSGSAFKLFAISWAIIWGVFFALILVIMLVVALAGGEVTFNDAPVSGPFGALVAVGPFLIMAPIIIGVHALMAGCLLTLGLMLYKVWRPVDVIELDG